MGSQPTSSLERHLGYWLRFVSNEVSGAFRERVAGHDVTVAEWVALRCLQDKAPCPLRVLAEEMGIDAGATSRLVERLNQKRLIARRVSPDDRRAVAIELTAAGKALVPKLAREADDNDDSFFKVLSQSDRQHLLRILKQLVEAHGLSEKPTN